MTEPAVMEPSAEAGDMEGADHRRQMEAAIRLTELLCADCSLQKATEVVGEMSVTEVQDLCTLILPSGHTALHLLAQRHKLGPLRAVLQRGVDVQARNGQGATPLHVALHHNALFSAKVLIDYGANTSEVVSRRKGTSLLHLMVTCHRLHAVTLLLEEKADVNARDLQGRTPFHLAAIYGNAAIAGVLSRHEQCDVNAVDASGHTAVMLAILNDNQDLARQLAEAPRVDLVRRDAGGMSCLHLAVSLGQLDVVRTILRRNTAHINGKEARMGRTPIHLASALVCSVDGLVTSSCLAEQTTEDGKVDQVNTKVKECAGSEPDFLPAASSSRVAQTSPRREVNGNVDEDEDMAEEDVETQVASLDSESVCVVASVNSSETAVGGSSRHALSPSSPQSAARQSQPSPRDSSRPSPQSKRPLANGAGPGRAEKGPPLSSRTPRRQPPPPLTERQDRQAGRAARDPRDPRDPSPPRVKITAAAKAQARHSISVDQPLASPGRQKWAVGGPRGRAGGSGRTPRPSTAPAHGHNVRHSQQRPVSSAQSSRRGGGGGRESAGSYRSRDVAGTVPVTPFNVGLVRCRLVALLLENGADPNLMTLFRKSPLHIAAILGAADVMALLLPHVTNVNVLSASNKTALHLAVEAGHVTLVTQLVHAGANLSLRDVAGMSALHLAASRGHAHIAALLLRARVEVNGCDFRQRMPLHHACLADHEAVIELLLRAGARTDRPDVDGVFPLQYRHRHQPSGPSPTITVDYTDTSNTDDLSNNNSSSSKSPLLHNNHVSYRNRNHNDGDEGDSCLAKDKARLRKTGVFHNIHGNALLEASNAPSNHTVGVLTNSVH